MKKSISVFVLSLLLSLGASAEDCKMYMAAKVGTKTEMKSYDKKNKETGTTKSTILDSAMDFVKFKSESFDAKGKPVGNGIFVVKCVDGNFLVDMNQFLSGIDQSAYKDMELKFESKQISIPSNLTAGQILNDGEVKMIAYSGGIKIMTLLIKITNRKVEGFEEVTTPAGTYSCAKISYDVETDMMVKVKTKSIDFISDKVGVVRQETYDSKNVLQGYSVLTLMQE